MRRASAQAWLASPRAGISQTGARSTLLKSNLTSLLAARQLSSHTAPRCAASTLRRLGLNALQPLRAGAKRAGGRYSTLAEGNPTLGKGSLDSTLYKDFQPSLMAETPEALDALRAEFFQWQRKMLNWNIGGIQVPKAVLWLVFFQFLGLAPYSYYTLAEADPLNHLRTYMKSMKDVTPTLPEVVPPVEVSEVQQQPGFRVRLSGWERTALHSAASLALVSVIALFWARRRTKKCFDSFILSRALGETTGKFLIGLENVVRKGDSIKVKGKSLKLVRSEVVRLAGIKAVQASAVLLLSSTLSSYALSSWLNAKAKDDIARLRYNSDAVRSGESVLSGILLLNFILSWLVLLYQPYTIFPFIASSVLAPLLPIPSSLDFTNPFLATVTEETKVIDVEGGKEYITTREKRTGSNVSRTETRWFIADKPGPFDSHKWSDEKKERDETVA